MPADVSSLTILTPSATLETPRTLDEGLALCQGIETAARVSHQSGHLQTPESWRRFVRHVVIDRGDWSVAEHATAHVVFICDRGVSHELVRHRHLSWTQESTRFVRYKHGLAVIVPPIDDPDALAHWRRAVTAAQEAYLAMLVAGQPPELARSVLPISTATQLVATGNLRAWHAFLRTRCTVESHPQMRQLIGPLLEQFQARIPVLFDEINPYVSQRDSLRAMR